MKKPVFTVFITISATFLIFSLLSLIMDEDYAFADNRRVAVCHYPPDDPTNPQTLYLPEKALQAHLKHGDVLGECPSGCILNASLCDDGNLCTSDTCLSNGDCENTPVDCDDGNPCTLDSCNAITGCLNVANNGISCDDGNACTYGDTCVDTACVGQAVPGCCASDSNCDDGDPCTVDACTSGTCTYSPKDCSVADKCLVGLCDQSSGNCTTALVSCNDGNPCTDDFCDSGTGCFSIPTSNPPPEVCDGIDNDCDGLIDESEFTSLSCSFEFDPGPQANWASMADYTAGILSVNFTLYNTTGDCTLDDVWVVIVENSNGVSSYTALPVSVGTITAGSSAVFTIQYDVPPSIPSFSNGFVLIDGAGFEAHACTSDITVPPPPAT